MQIAAQFHPGFAVATPTARKLRAHDHAVLLSRDTPSRIHAIIFWTSRTRSESSTGMIFRIARDHHIPAFNLADCPLSDVRHDLLLIPNHVWSES